MKTWNRRVVGGRQLIRALWFAPMVIGLQLGVSGQAVAQDTAEEKGAQAPEASERRFDVFEYRIDGNSVLDARAIESAVQPYLGPQRTIQDIEAARASLEKAYRSRGYETVGVEIPEQDVRTGIVRFNVLELQVGRLRVVGSRYYSPEDIKKRVPSLAEGQVPKYDLVAKDIEKINNARDRSITPTLRAGDMPGTVDVDLQVDDKMPLHSTFELNDRYSQRTSRLRAVAMLSYSNLFQRDHSLSMQVQTAPADLDDSMVVSASYLAPLSREVSLIAYAVHTNSDIAAVGGINVIGNGDVYGMRAIRSLPGGNALLHSLSFGIDYKDFKEDLKVGTGTDRTPISYAPLAVEYSATLLDGTGSTRLNSSLNFGLRAFGATAEEFALKRFNARPNYIYYRADLERTQNLPGGFRAIAAFGGQISDQPLISNEQYSIGGVDSVRGYMEGQELGDTGMRASLQFETPSLFSPSGLLDEWRVFVFGDWGEVRIRDPLADPLTGKLNDSKISLTSVGLGTQLRAWKNVNAMLLLAAPLQRKNGTELDIDDKYRGQFRLWTEF